MEVDVKSNIAMQEQEVEVLSILLYN